MAYLAPAEFVTRMVDAGEAKLLMSTRDTLIRSYMAGAILSLAAAFAVAVVVPGALTGRALHLPWPVAVAAGPPVTFAIVGLWSVLLGLADVPWNLPTALAALGLTPAVCLLGARVASRRNRPPALPGHDAVPDASGLLAVAAGVGLAAVTIVVEQRGEHVGWRKQPSGASADRERGPQFVDRPVRQRAVADLGNLARAPGGERRGEVAQLVVGVAAVDVHERGGQVERFGGDRRRRLVGVDVAAHLSVRDRDLGDEGGDGIREGVR